MQFFNKHSEESLLFVEEISVFEAIDDRELLLSKAQTIVNNFIKPNSPNELNIDHFVRKAVMNEIENISADGILRKQIFYDVVQVVYRELKEDAFPRYVRSDSFTNFATSKGEEYIRSLSIHISQLENRNLLFMPKDFVSDTITDHDICFLLHLCKDSPDWEALSVTKKNKLEKDYYPYISRADYCIGGNERMKLGKFTGFLPCSATHAMETLFNIVDFTRLGDPNIIGLTSLGVSEPDPANGRPYPVHYYDTLLSFLIKRRVTMFGTVVYDTERQCYIVVLKTTTAEPVRTYCLW